MASIQNYPMPMPEPQSAETPVHQTGAPTPAAPPPGVGGAVPVAMPTFPTYPPPQPPSSAASTAPVPTEQPPPYTPPAFAPAYVLSPPVGHPFGFPSQPLTSPAHAAHPGAVYPAYPQYAQGGGGWGGSAGGGHTYPPNIYEKPPIVAEASIADRMAFVRKVYFILTIMIAVTVAVTAVVRYIRVLRFWFIVNGFWIVWVFLALSLLFMFLLMWQTNRETVRNQQQVQQGFLEDGRAGTSGGSRGHSPLLYIFLVGFNVSNALVVAGATVYYDVAALFNSFLLTGGLFLVLTVFAVQSKIDFSGWGVWLYSTLWFIIIALLISFFLPYSSVTGLVLSIVIVALFSALVIYDTFNLFRVTRTDQYILSAVSLYLDIVNLFLAVLYIVGFAGGR